MRSTCHSLSRVYPSLTNPIHTKEQQSDSTQRLTLTEADAVADELRAPMPLSCMDVDTMHAAHEVKQGLLYIHRRRLAHKLMSSIWSENHKSMRRSTSANGGNTAAVFWSYKPTCIAGVFSAFVTHSVQCDSPALTMTQPRVQSMPER